VRGRAVIAAFGIAAVAVPLAMWAFVRMTVGNLERKWRADVDEERARRERAPARPPLRGEARDVDAAAEYMAILGRSSFSESHAEVAKLQGVVVGAPGPIPGDVVAILERHRDDIAALREATRGARCGPLFDLVDHAGRSPPPNLLYARTLANLLLLEGEERARAGDARGAAERDLDCMRFGADLGADGSLLCVLVGISVRALGEEALARRIASGALAVGDLAEVERELSVLDGLVAPLERTVRLERIEDVGKILAVARGETSFSRWGGAPDWRERALTAWGAGEVDRIMRLAEDACRIEDRRARNAAFGAVAGEVDRSRSLDPLVIAVPNVAAAAEAVDEELARRRVVRAAAAVARFRAERGAYPAAIAEAGPGVPLVAWEGAPLGYERAEDGASARVFFTGAVRGFAVELGKPPP
jgi:hypothetical protein